MGEPVPIESRSENTVTKTKETSLQESAELMEVHKTAMESQLYKSFQVYIINKVRSKIEIHLGISGEKIEIDPVQQKSTKFAIVKQKAVSHHMDSVVWCDIIEEKSKENKIIFRIIYSSSYGSNSNSFESGSSNTFLQSSSANFKHYDFEAEQNVAKKLVQKIKQILEIRSSTSRKEYMELRERKIHKKKSFTNK